MPQVGVYGKAEADADIVAHAAVAAAHHAKTTKASEITSETFVDARIPDGIARDTEVTAAVGAEATARAEADAALSTEIDEDVAAEATARDEAIGAHSDLDTGVHGVGASTVCSLAEAAGLITTHDGLASPHSAAGFAKLTLCNIEVFSGTSPDPAAWTDLDLSTWVGANPALVVLRLYNPEAAVDAVGFRPKGETEADPYVDAQVDGSTSTFGHEVQATSFSLFITLTSDVGVVEWKYLRANQAGVTIDLIGYSK